MRPLRSLAIASDDGLEALLFSRIEAIGAEVCARVLAGRRKAARSARTEALPPALGTAVLAFFDVVARSPIG
jgi:hypothetical protein